MSASVSTTPDLQLHVLGVLANIGCGTHYDIHASSPKSTELEVTKVESTCRALAKKGLIQFQDKKRTHEDRQYSLTNFGKKTLESSVFQSSQPTS